MTVAKKSEFGVNNLQVHGHDGSYIITRRLCVGVLADKDCIQICCV